MKWNEYFSVYVKITTGTNKTSILILPVPESIISIIKKIVGINYTHQNVKASETYKQLPPANQPKSPVTAERGKF
jgi:hypothetical protein